MTQSDDVVRLLVVDDDSEDVETLCELLRPGIASRRYEIDWEPSYRAALQRLATRQHDACLLDLYLGERDGLDLLSEAISAGGWVPIVVVTGRYDRRAEACAATTGAADFLVKDGLDTAGLERTVRNAIERARAVRTLRERERQLRAVFDGATDAMLIVDDTGRYLDANVAALQLFDLSLEALTQRRISDLSAGAAGEKFQAAWSAFLAAGSMAGEWTVRRADGSERQVEFRATANITPGRHLSVLRDVTERKKLEAQLAQSDRMASVGTLAAGVAHEINNPLAALISNLNSVTEDLSAPGRPEDPREALKDAVDAAERIRLVVRDLKLFSRPDEEKRGPVDVRLAIDSALRLAWNELRHRARVVRDFGDVAPVLANESRLGQVFLNLVMNAAQAIREGDAARNEVRIKTQMMGQRVQIEVADTGSGMSAATLKRLFEPFFTTKPVGVGTGLGLSICRRLVEDCGGTIGVQSEEGKGTCFTITLPCATPAPQPVPRVEATSAAPSTRRRVLVIDDDPLVGTAVRRSLSSVHDVTVVQSASEGLAALERLDSDLILCDMMMPQMTGMDFYAELERLRPALCERVIFVTGGAFTEASRTFLEEVGNPVIEKPFSPSGLRELVNQRLAALSAEPDADSSSR